MADERYSERAIVCPYCGNEDADEFLSLLGGGSVGYHYTCPACDSVFAVAFYVRASARSFPLDDWADDAEVAS